MKNKSFLFVTIDGGGNLPPVLGLAKRLADRGNKITVLTEPCLEEVVRSAGYDFIPFKKHFTRKNRNEDLFKDANTNPITNPVLDAVVFGPTKTIVEETHLALKQSGADVLMADCMLPSALIAAEALALPRVLIFHFPEYFPGPNRPPGIMGLKVGNGFLYRLRDRLLGFLFHKKLNSYLPMINDVREKYSLKKLNSIVEMVDGADLRLIQTLKSFDFPLEPAPRNVRYVGPVLDDPDWINSWEIPWKKDDLRPLVVISLSSTFQDQKGAIQESINALKNLDVRGLVTLGPAMNISDFDYPDNVVLLKSAPHSQVFPVADLVITHTGHGTLMRALANGLPVICLPMGRDQNDNAVKVEHHGCGIKLSPKSKADRIRKAVLQVLNNSDYRKKAQRFQEEIISVNQKNITIEEIEKLMMQESEKVVEHQPFS